MMHRHRRWNTAGLGTLTKSLCFAVLLAAVVVLNAAGEPAAASVGSAVPRVGYRAPDITVKTLTGTEVTLGEQLGTPIFINFFATWCYFCRVEMPHIESLYEEVGDEVNFMIVDIGESRETVTAYFEAEGWTVPAYLDSTGAAGNRYAVRGLPTSFFIDSDGVIRDMVIGAMTEARLRQGIESILSAGSD
ncbi:MAG: redoxin domain-containing protein [Firmicutes bacterium]|jgi:thiol-disulfide isomerase/thioredoxin|nr:redoxin domain-containing protein [Bacillota bacterium]